MQFETTLNIERLPIVGNTHDEAEALATFNQISVNQENLFVISWIYNSHRSIGIRNVGIFTEADKDGKSDDTTMRLMYDDFLDPEQDGWPDWHASLFKRILSVKAVERYGPNQGVRVTERIQFGCAVGKVREVLVPNGNQFCLEVRIGAQGCNAFTDTRKLHKLILAGGTE